MKKYYKLLTKRPDGKLVSYLIHDLRSRWAIIYKPKAWTSPKTGKIFIFTSLAAVEEFCPSRYCQPVWVCEAKGVEWIPPDFPRDTMFQSEWLRNWELFDLGEMEKGSNLGNHWFPWGTILADKVKLIKQVYP